jgi:glucose uptake protein GlcU
MKNAKFILIGVAVVLIIGHISVTDFEDLSWSNNSGSYLGIIAMILLVISIVITLVEKKNK